LRYNLHSNHLDCQKVLWLTHLKPPFPFLSGVIQS
jgi:hypothetical protein